MGGYLGLPTGMAKSFRTGSDKKRRSRFLTLNREFNVSLV